MSDMAPIEEELQQGFNRAKMLMREGKVEEALRLIDELERRAAPYADRLPPNILYLIPFSRGRAYLQTKQPDRARPELEAALELTGSDIEACARTQNLLGVAYYEQEDPSSALTYHLECLHALEHEGIKDLNFRLSVYKNLANDYWALNNISYAIGAYKEALSISKDLDAPERQAEILWGLALAYRVLREWRYARLHVTQAIQIYQSTRNKVAEAAMNINFADILLEEGRTDKVAQSLDRAAQLLAGTDDPAALSFMHRYYTELCRREGKLEEAGLHAAESVRYAEMLLSPEYAVTNRLWANPVRAYAEALHGAALVEEARDDTQAADQLFARALEELEKVKVKEIKDTLCLSYASVLEARGDYERAVRYYKAAIQPNAQSGSSLL
ncbi:MAG TPA: tetratricopeptide repeat protein [Chloroflexia bacterium]|nr:tetratricopeptide repeat protein [Chloroflexia bacterium]